MTAHGKYVELKVIATQLEEAAARASIVLPDSLRDKMLEETFEGSKRRGQRIIPRTGTLISYGDKAEPYLRQVAEIGDTMYFNPFDAIPTDEDGVVLVDIAGVFGKAV